MMIQSRVGDAFYPTHRLGPPMILRYGRLVRNTFLNFRLSQDYCRWQARTNFLKILEIQQKRNPCQNKTTAELCKNNLDVWILLQDFPLQRCFLG